LFLVQIHLPWKLKWPTVKPAEDPKRYSRAGQNSGKDSDPRNHEATVAGAFYGGASLSRDAEPMKEQETGTTRGTAEDVAAHHEG
jgi:general stress protein YciG